MAAAKDQYAAVLLLGDRDAVWKAKTGFDYRALTELKGKSMVQRVLQALAASGRVKSLALAGPQEVVEAAAAAAAPLFSQPKVTCVFSQASLPEKAWQAVMKLGLPEKVLFVCEDLPFLTGTAVSGFLTVCEQLEGDGFYPLGRKETCRADYPSLQRTYFKLREGSFTGGNLMLVRSSCIPKLLKLSRKFYAARKKPYRLAWVLGITFCLRLAAGCLSAAAVERRLYEISGFHGCLLLGADPVLAEDLDNADDCAEAARYLDTVPEQSF